MANYGCILTAIGRAKIASAIITGIPVVITQMAVGDGAGNPIAPSAAQTALVREVYRRSINAIAISPTDPDTLLLEMVIPSTEGPFVIREVGVFDEDDNLIAISSLPASTKPAPSEGATKDVVIILSIKVDSSAAVTVVINPNIVIATRTWVDGNYLRLPGAGATGQLIRKKTNTPNDWEFFNPEFDATNFIFDCIEEPQTLATDQTLVQFLIITTAGLAVYVEKTDGGLERLVRDQDFTIVDETHIELAVSYLAGSRILGVQNDPNGAVSPHGIGALERTENLADVINKATARANLQLSYASQEEAEAGAELLKVMSPLRVLQLINKLIPETRRGHEVAELGFFYRRTVPSNAWLPLRGGTFGPSGSAATVRANDDCWPLYEIWWSDFSQTLLPVTGGRGVSAAADWAASKPMAIFNDVDEFYRAWNSADITHDLGTHQDDAVQRHRHFEFSDSEAMQYGLSGYLSPSASSHYPTERLDYIMGAGAALEATKGVTSPPVGLSYGDPVRAANETRVKNRAVLVCVHL